MIFLIEQKFSITNRSLVLHLEVLTKASNKTSTSGNKLLLQCINFKVEVSIGQKFSPHTDHEDCELSDYYYQLRQELILLQCFAIILTFHSAHTAVPPLSPYKHTNKNKCHQFHSLPTSQFSSNLYEHFDHLCARAQLLQYFECFLF